MNTTPYTLQTQNVQYPSNYMQPYVNVGYQALPLNDINGCMWIPSEYYQKHIAPHPPSEPYPNLNKEKTNSLLPLHTPIPKDDKKDCVCNCKTAIFFSYILASAGLLSYLATYVYQNAYN